MVGDGQQKRLVMKGRAMTNRITWIVRHVYSKRDNSGNCYHMAQFIKVSNYEAVWFETNHISNANNVAHELTGSNNRFYAYEEEIPKRRFFGLRKSMQLLDDCNPAKAAKQVRRAFKELNR